MFLFFLFIYKLRTQCHTIKAETVQITIDTGAGRPKYWNTGGLKT